MDFSKNLGSLWEDLGKAMEGEDEIEVGEVDCGSNKPVCSKVDIHSYPTFKLFYEGEEVAKYKGKFSTPSPPWQLHCFISVFLLIHVLDIFYFSFSFLIS